MLTETVIKRLTLSRYLFHLASDHAYMHRGVAGFACINMLQDAVEIFLLAAAEHLSATIGRRTDFEQYLDVLNEQLAPNALPFRRRLIEINKVRVLSKHDGISPDAAELSGHVGHARNFFERACTQIFARDFWSVSLVELLNDGEKKELLSEAEKHFGGGDYAACLISCRKAFYIEFERSFDVQGLPERAAGLLGLWGSDAPRYAAEKDYAEKYVFSPFDYIVYDHSKINANLNKEGIDNGIYWNIWRLTPEVYRHGEEEWKVKHDPRKSELPGLKERAAYVLENTVDLILKKERNFRALKWVQSGTKYVVALARPGVPVYRKADKAGDLIENTPADVVEVGVDFATPGLHDEEVYWSASYEGSSGWISGFILQEDLHFKN